MCIMVMTANPVDSDYVLSLELGADDYLQKPFDTMKLAAKVSSLLRRKMKTEQHASEEVSFGTGRNYSFGRWVIDLKTRVVKVAETGEDMMMTGSAYDLLVVFLKNSNKVLDRDFLMQEFRGRLADAYDRTIDVQISRLRNYFGKDRDNIEYFKTVHRKGYMFTADVKQI